LPYSAISSRSGFEGAAALTDVDAILVLARNPNAEWAKRRFPKELVLVCAKAGARSIFK
jgi:hypothetical protein